MLVQRPVNSRTIPSLLLNAWFRGKNPGRTLLRSSATWIRRTERHSLPRLPFAHNRRVTNGRSRYFGTAGSIAALVHSLDHETFRGWKSFRNQLSSFCFVTRDDIAGLRYGPAIIDVRMPPVLHH